MRYGYVTRLSSEVQKDCGSVAELAFGLYAASVGLDKVLYDGETKAGSAFLARAAR